MNLIAIPLGKLLSLCFELCGDYLAAVILFTFITKLILFPVNIAVQKNGIKMVKIMPEINELKCGYYGDKEMVNEETLKLYKRENYNPFLSLVPAVVQLILLMGVIEVVREPAFSGISDDRMISFGIDLSMIPAERGGLYLMFPLAAALSAVIMCTVQNKVQVLQAEQGNFNKYGMMLLSSLLSLYLGFFIKAGIAVYWTFGNLFSVAVLFILNAVIDPKKYIDYEKLEQSKAKLKAMSNHGQKLTPEMRKRQRRDYKRFFSIENKHIVFYSEKSGFFKYYSNLINWLTDHSNIKIHYITSDPNDAIFEYSKEHSSIIPYFIGENRLITLFMKMDAKIVVMTTPDLDNFHIKRSRVCKDVEYIYIHHAMTSINMLIRKGALDHYDTVFCAGQHVIDELTAMEELYKLPHKRLIKTGYGLLDDLIKSYGEWKSSVPDETAEKYFLLAPSHQQDNILDSCLDIVVEGLKRHAPVVIRPHPQYIVRFGEKWDRIAERYADDPLVRTESDFSSNDTVYKAAAVVTDWSTIGYEFSFSTLRPVLFVDTPMKIINPDYKEINIEPIDITIRNRVGISVSGKSADEVSEAAEKLLSDEYLSADGIRRVRDETVFNIMNSGECGGKYILSKLKKAKDDKNEK